MKPPTRPTVITRPLSRVATKVAASTRGTTSRWIGSMPSTSRASISSRMVRAPKSAQMAVDPAPATTSTVVSGPSWVTAPSAAPAPEMSAAPNSTSRMLSVKMSSTVSGIDTMIVGRIATRMMNQPCRMNSRHWNGQRNSALPVRTHIRKKPPTRVSGVRI